LASYTHSEAVGWIWSVADIIRDQTHQRHEMGDAILPFVVLRRLDQAAEATRSKAIETAEKYTGRGIEGEMLEQAIAVAVGQPFYNTAPITFDELIDDPDHLEDNLWDLVNGFSPNVRDILEKFEFKRHVDKFVAKNLLYPVVARFCEIDLDPGRVSNLDMGYIFEELIRRFSELKNEEAGHHYTPREVIRLMVDLLLTNVDDLIYEPGKIVTMLDPACGTGGMLSVAEQRLRDLNADVDFRPFGQDFDDQSYAIALSEQLMTGRRELNIALGNSLTDQDAYAGRHFDFVIANPPYGVKWNQYAGPIEREHEREEFDGRYGAGLPRKSDGQLLFVQHMISKMQPVDDTTPGTRIAIVMNGSPMFSGDAGSGESEIRRWIIENDYLDAIVGLPNDLFYNTGISTYVWILTNNKPASRQGRVQLIDARDLYAKMKRSLGNKRNELADEHIATIVSLYGDETENGRSKWVADTDLGYVKVPVQRPRRARIEGGPDALTRLKANPDWQDLSVRKGTDDPDHVRDTVEQALAAALPTNDLTLATAKKRLKEADGWTSLLRKSKDAVLDALLVDDPDAQPLRDGKGNPVPDPDLRGYETVPLDRDIDDHLAAEVHPQAPHAWAEHDKAKVGYEIPFTEIFYVYEPPPPLEEIDAELRKVEQEILDLLTEVTK
jgi:type I restriction enzyme M protein